MQLTRGEENRNRAIAGVSSIAIIGLLLLFLILFNIITPNPPFPEGGGGGGQELALGMMNMGNDNVDYSDMGSATDVVAQKPEAKEEIVTEENGEVVPMEKQPEKKEEPKPEVKNNTTVITPVKPREETAAEKLAKKFKKNTGKTGGGVGDNAEAGQSGSPDGDPFKHGTGGHGTGNGGGDGEGTGPGSGPGFGGGRGGGFGANLAGRKVVGIPKLPTDTKEEGKVVVEITVDKEGNVIEANPNGRGTTTSSALLKAKAKQAAMATKFSPNDKYDEQNGTITIIFSFD